MHNDTTETRYQYALLILPELKNNVLLRPARTIEKSERVSANKHLIQMSLKHAFVPVIYHAYTKRNFNLIQFEIQTKNNLKNVFINRKRAV